MYSQKLDVTQVTHREEIALAFGEAAAWRAAVARYTHLEARADNPQRKRKLRLMLLNAQNQLRLVTEKGE